MEKIEYPGIELMTFAVAVVAQITVQASQRFLIVARIIAVDDVQVLSSMCVNKTQSVWTVRNSLWFWLGGAGDQPAGEDQHEHEETAKISWRPGQGKRLRDTLATSEGPELDCIKYKRVPSHV